MEIEALSEELQHSRRAALAKVESFRADLELIKKELSVSLMI